MSLPTVFPIFPLTQVLLVPGDLLPLHIFEPRYREMVADALAGNRAIAMAASTDAASFGDPPVDPIVGLGRLVHRQLYPDGRSDIVLEGLGRMEIVEELTSDTSYRVVRAREVPEVLGADEEALRKALLELIPRFFQTDEEQLETASRLPVARLADSVLLRLPVSPPAKHAIFSMHEVAARIAALEAAVDELHAPPASMRFEMGDPRLN